MQIEKCKLKIKRGMPMGSLETTRGSGLFREGMHA
jgi:hypothetical protein